MRMIRLLPLAIVLAACGETGDSLVAIAGPSYDHGEQSGQAGHAYHGYSAPDLVWDGNAGTLCASWSDHAMNTTFYSFEFSLWNVATESWDEVDDVRGDETGANACLDVEGLGLPDGTYTFQAVGMAREGTGRETTTHHTAPATRVVTLGGLIFRVQLRGQSNAPVEGLYDFQKNANNWNLQFYVQIWDGTDWVYVTDCAALPYGDITTVAEWGSPGTEQRTATPDATDPCDVVGRDSRAAYKVGLTNAYKGSTSSGELVFRIGGSTNENTVHFATH